MKAEPLILALETALTTGSLSILKGDRIANSIRAEASPLRADNLLSLINELFEQIDVDLHQLDLIAVSSGPGSFTGIRVGMATAQGLGLALKRPYLGISVLEAMKGEKDCHDKSLIYTTVPAGRNKIYWQRFAGATPDAGKSEIQLTDTDRFIQELLSRGEIAKKVVTEKSLYYSLKEQFKQKDGSGEINFIYASDNVSELIGNAALRIIRQQSEIAGNEVLNYISEKSEKSE